MVRDKFMIVGFLGLTCFTGGGIGMGIGYMTGLTKIFVKDK